MHPENLPAPSAANAAAGHAPDALPAWAAIIEATPEPALLSRLLQRLTVQGVVLDQLRYDADDHGGLVRVEVLFRTDADRARLLARRWETVVTVQRVELCAAVVSRLRAAPRAVAA